MAKKNIQITYVITDAALLKSKTALQQNEKSAKDADAAINKFGKDAAKAGNDASKSFLNLGTIWKGLIAVGIVNFMVDLGKKTLDLGIKQQQLNIAFTTFLGSADKAKKLLGELTKFAIITPFTPDQVNNAAKALLAFGVKGEEIIPTLKMLGDVSSGTGKDLTEMAVIFGQIRSTGRLMGQDLLQLINAGFNPLQIISEKTGRSVKDLKKDMENGLISFDMVSDAFKSATSEGGLFFNLMEKQSVSVGGLLSTVSGNVDEALKSIFAANTGRVAGFVTMLVKASEGLMKLAETADQAKDRINQSISDQEKKSMDFLMEQAVKDGLTKEDAIKATEKVLNEQYDAAVARQRALGASDEEAQRTAFHDVEVKKQQIRAFKDYISVLGEEALKNKLKDDADKNQILTIEKLKEQSKQLGVQIEKSNIADVQAISILVQKKDALDDYIKSLTKATDVQFKLKNIDTVKDNSLAPDKVQAQKFALGGSDLRNDIFGGIDQIKTDNDRLAEIKLANDNQLAEWQREADAEVDIENQKQQRKQQLTQAAFQYGAQLIQQLLTMSIQANNETFVREKGNFDRRVTLAGDNERAKMEIEAERTKFEADQDKKQAEAEKKQAQRQKEIQIKQMIITNFANALRALGTPPVPNFAAAGIAAGFGLAEIIAAKAIGFKEGVIGLNGPGNGTSDSIPARLSKGESVITAKATERSYDLLEAINNGSIDDSILRKLKVSSSGVSIVNNNKDLVNEIRALKVTRYEDGYFTMNEIEKSKGFKLRMKSKYRS